MSISNIRMIVSCESITREFTPEDLAQEIGVETVRPALLAMMLRPGPLHSIFAAVPSFPGEPTEGAVRSVDRTGTKIASIDGPPRSIEGSQEINMVRSDRSNDGTRENILSEIDRSNGAREKNVFAENRSLPTAPGSSMRSAALAQRLAHELDDPGGLSWYRTLTATLDADTIMDALARTLRVPAAKIRTTRGAYFTSVINPLYRETRDQKSLHPYDPTHSQT